MSPTDAELVAAHLAGDRSALAAIYDRYADSLYDTAASMTRSRHDAADVVQDVFVIAAERLGQLRDPSRLKPWLFAVLRNEVYRRTGKQRRTVATDFSEPAAEMMLPPDDQDVTANVEHDELAALVRGAAAGLDERDQLILELNVRQGLEGDDLADALGVSAQQCYGMLHRMRQRTERSLAAYCVARQGRRDCPELAEILRGWDGEFSVLIRKRVARHIDRCETCESKRRALAPLALFGAAPVFAAPTGLRDRVLAAVEAAAPLPQAGSGTGAGGAASYGFGAPGGFPSAIKYVQKVALWVVMTVAAVLLTTGTTVYVLADGGSDEPAATPTTTTTLPATTTTTGATTATVPATTTPVLLPPAVTTSTVPAVTTTAVPTTTSTSSTTTTTTTTTTLPATTTAPPPTPGLLQLPTATIDFGTSAFEARVRLSNPGESPAVWSATTGPVGFAGVASPFSFSPTAGTIQPGDDVEVVFTFDRSWPAEGVRTQRVTFVGGANSVAIDLIGTIARPPVVRVDLPAATHCPIDTSTGAELPLKISVDVSDDSMPPTGTFVATHPTAGTVKTGLTSVLTTLESSVSLDTTGDGVPEIGVWTWQISVSDALGNTTVANGTTDVQTASCP